MHAQFCNVKTPHVIICIIVSKPWQFCTTTKTMGRCIIIHQQKGKMHNYSLIKHWTRCSNRVSHDLVVGNSAITLSLSVGKPYHKVKQLGDRQSCNSYWNMTHMKLCQRALTQQMCIVEYSRAGIKSRLTRWRWFAHRVP